jgi:hypothetical protein
MTHLYTVHAMRDTPSSPWPQGRQGSRHRCKDQRCMTPSACEKGHTEVAMAPHVDTWGHEQQENDTTALHCVQAVSQEIVKALI